MRVHRSAIDVTLRAALLVSALVVLGETGHIVLEQFELDLGHHLFHILFPLVAFAIFAAFVARDVRAHGWPTFSWRLAPEATRTTERER
jgi:hypothetical protein